jgi:protein-serine/threonine kinase
MASTLSPPPALDAAVTANSSSLPHTSLAEQPISPAASSSSNSAPAPVYRSMLDIGQSQKTPNTPSKDTSAVLPAVVDTPESDESPPTPALEKQETNTLKIVETAPDDDRDGIVRSVTSPNFTYQQKRPAFIPRNTSERTMALGQRKKTSGTPPSPTNGQMPREGLMSRVGSFLNKRKSQNNSPAPELAGSKIEKIPSFALSQSSHTSVSGTPPSPGSRESTIAERGESREGEDEDASLTPKQMARGHSSSTSVSQAPPSPRIGITWGPNYTDEGVEFAERPRQRRRSISHDHTNHAASIAMGRRESQAPVDLMATFSYMSIEGVGMKARRLSTSLPDEFFVDSCELDAEFRSSSHFPGRRGQTVGKGATATVKLMYKKNDKTNTYYAVKEFRKMDKSEDPVEYVKKVKSEYCIAQSLHHPNIVNTVRLCTHNGRWNHVMEYCLYGEMFHWVEKGMFRDIFKLTDKQCLFKQLIRGVDYLHSNGIAHRDIKLENLLLSAEGYLKITDFGVSEVFAGEHPGLRTAGGKCGINMGDEVRRCPPGICGSMPYIAPEVLLRDRKF